MYVLFITYQDKRIEITNRMAYWKKFITGSSRPKKSNPITIKNP
jgi:hypothetical protein